MGHQSDSQRPTAEADKSAVRASLREHGEVASKATLRADTDVLDWYIDQLASTDLFYTSLTHDGRYVASKYIVGHRADHNGFWRPEVDEEGPAVFHRQETTADTLTHLVRNRPSGLTAAEATDLLGRRCYRALDSLADQGDVVAAEVGDMTVYVHTWERLRDAPLLTAINPRRSSPLKALKAEIKAVFEQHGEEIETVHNAFERLPQQLLSDYGVEVGGLEASTIYWAIKERLNRHLRSGIERVFDRLKGFTGLDAIRTQQRENVETHLVMSVVALVTAAFAAHRHDKPGVGRSLAGII